MEKGRIQMSQKQLQIQTNRNFSEEFNTPIAIRVSGKSQR